VFEAKLNFLKKAAQRKNLSHFVVVEQLKCNAMWSNTMNMRQILWSAFHNCIRDLTNESGFHSREQMTIVTQPFSIEVKHAPTELEMDMDLFDLQCNEFIKSKFNEAPLIDLSQVCALRKLSQIEERRSTT